MKRRFFLYLAHQPPIGRRRMRGLFLWGVALLLLAGSLFAASGSALASTAKPVLQVAPGILHGNTDCAYISPQGWVCSTTLSRGDTLSTNLTWSAYSNGIPGIVFTPASGVIAAGGNATVSVAIPDTVCPAHATLIFKGQGNTVKVPWSCTAPTLTLDQTQLSAGTTCPDGVGGWNCTVHVGEPADAQGELNWFAKSSLSGITFTPASGTLSPGASTAVQIFVPASACRSGTLTFGGSGGTEVRVHWTCSGGPPPTAALTVTPASLVPTSSACSFDGTVYQCTVTLSETSNSQANVNWNAIASLGNAVVVPSQGTLTPGGSTSIMVQSLSCQNGSVTFSAAIVLPQTVTWNCEPATLTLNVTSLVPTSPNCGTVGSTPLGEAYGCTVTLSEVSDAQGPIDWSATATGPTLSGEMPVFNPGSGTISPGQSVPVTIAPLFCGTNTVLTFAGPNGEGAVSVPFAC